MAGIRALVLICWAGLAAAQVKFPGKSDTPTTDTTTTTTTTSNPKAASQQDAPLQPSQPANLGQTRFAPGFGGNPDILGLFSQCQHCSFSNLQLAHHCCQARQLCCSFLQTSPGQFSGHLPGVVGAGGILGQVGPQGIFGAAGGKGGTCPLVAGLQSGFGRFNGAACAVECHNDYNCPGQKKCCPAGCSTICRNPSGALVPPIVIQPRIKPGSCPPKGLLGFLGLRSGAAGDTATSVAPATTASDTDARLQEKETRKERRINRKERQKRKRNRRSPARQDQEDRRERRRNRLGRIYGRVTRSADVRHREDRRERQRNRKNRVFGRVIRSANVRHREDRRERQRNRKHRVFGRVIRSAGLDDYDDNKRNKRRRFNRHEIINNRVIRQADPKQRFFLGNHFCQNKCFNDFECPGNLKCCSRNKNCNECINPTYP